MAILFYVIGGAFVYLLLGLFFVGTEVRWGFPFGHALAASEKERMRIAKEWLEDRPILNILLSPIAFVLFILEKSVLGTWKFFLNGFRFKSAG